jgi:hypothetical protein
MAATPRRLPTILPWLLCAATLSLAVRAALRAPPPANIPAAVARLESRGLRLRVVPVAKGGGLAAGAYLTTTAKGWEELSRLPCTTARIGRWRGTVLLKRDTSTDRWEVPESDADCFLVVGTLVFFGDPALLAGIRDALADPR